MLPIIFLNRFDSIWIRHSIRIHVHVGYESCVAMSEIFLGFPREPRICQSNLPQLSLLPGDTCPFVNPSDHPASCSRLPVNPWGNAQAIPRHSVIHVVQIETGYVFETVVAFEQLVTSIESRSGGFGDASAPEKSRRTSHALAPHSARSPAPTRSRRDSSASDGMHRARAGNRAGTGV